MLKRSTTTKDLRNYTPGVIKTTSEAEQTRAQAVSDLKKQINAKNGMLPSIPIPIPPSTPNNASNSPLRTRPRSGTASRNTEFKKENTLRYMVDSLFVDNSETKQVVVRSIESIVCILNSLYISIDIHSTSYDELVQIPEVGKDTFGSTVPDIENDYLQNMIASDFGLAEYECHNFMTKCFQCGECIPGSLEWSGSDVHKTLLGKVRAVTPKVFTSLHQKFSQAAQKVGSMLFPFDDINKTPLATAIFMQRSAFISQLLSMICDLCSNTLVCRTDAIMHASVQRGYVDSLRNELIAKFGDIVHFITSNLLELHHRNTSNCELELSNRYAAWSESAHRTNPSVQYSTPIQIHPRLKPPMLRRTAHMMFNTMVTRGKIPTGLYMDKCGDSDMLSDASLCVRQFVSVITPHMALLVEICAAREAQIRHTVAHAAYMVSSDATDGSQFRDAIYVDELDTAARAVNGSVHSDAFSPEHVYSHADIDNTTAQMTHHLFVTAQAAEAVARANEVVAFQYRMRRCISEQAVTSSIVMLVESEVRAQCTQLMTRKGIKPCSKLLAKLEMLFSSGK